MKINLPHKIKIWVQGQVEPIWVTVEEYNEKGFPTKVKTDSGKILNRSRMMWSVMVWEDMIV